MMTKKELIELLKNVPDDTIIVVDTHAQTFNSHMIEVKNAFYMGVDYAESVNSDQYFIIELPYFTRTEKEEIELDKELSRIAND